MNTAKKVLLTLALILALVFVLTACGGGGGDQSSSGGEQSSSGGGSTEHTHAFGAWKTTKEASCVEDGIEVRACSCGEIEAQAIPAPGHFFGGWIVVKDPTDTEDGTKVRICACGEQETEAIPATQPDTPPHTHTFDQKIATSAYLKSAASCTEAAVYYYSCTCGEKGSSTFAYGSTSEHVYDQKNTMGSDPHRVL